MPLSQLNPGFHFTTLVYRIIHQSLSRQPSGESFTWKLKGGDGYGMVVIRPTNPVQEESDPLGFLLFLFFFLLFLHFVSLL